MKGLIGLIILVLDIVAILDCVKSDKTTGKKVLWVILILVLLFRPTGIMGENVDDTRV